MNKRNTIQRALVLEAVRALRCHATADEVYQSIAARHQGISRATVYRNLNTLAEAGEIRKLQLPGGPDRFDHLAWQHYHARCLHCGRVLDVDMPVIPDLDKGIRDTQGFAFTGHDVIFTGLCRDCRPTV